LIEDSRPAALVSLTLGGVALAVAVLAPFVLLALNGLSDYEVVGETLESPELRAALVVAVIAGGAAVVVGLATYRRMDTRVARNEAISGLILGAQAVVVGAAVLGFTSGDMVTFARHFLNLDDVTGQTDAFLQGMWNTVLLASISAVAGILLGLMIAVFAVSQRAIVRAPARIYVNLIRGTPLLLQLAVIYFGLALGLAINWTPFVALIVGLSLNAGAYTAEIFRAGLQSIERGQLEAARGLGLTYFASMRFVVVPQAVRRVIPPLMNEYIILIKDTSLIAFLGVALAERDIFTVATTGYAQYFNATFYVASGLGYLAITLPLIAAVSLLEKRLRSGLVAVG